MHVGLHVICIVQSQKGWGVLFVCTWLLPACLTAAILPCASITHPKKHTCAVAASQTPLAEGGQTVMPLLTPYLTLKCMGRNILLDLGKRT